MHAKLDMLSSAIQISQIWIYCEDGQGHLAKCCSLSFLAFFLLKMSVVRFLELIAKIRIAKIGITKIGIPIGMDR
jgi:hypothetical protein